MHSSRRTGSTVFTLVAWLAGVALIVAGAYLALRWLAMAVTTTRIVEGPVIRAVYATGTISPQREYPIRATNAGRLADVWVDKGDAVAAGQAVAQIAEPDVEFAVARARAELDEKRARAADETSPVLAEFDARLSAAREQLGIAQREEARQRANLARDASSSVDVDRAADRTQTVAALVGSLVEQRASKRLELQREASVAESALTMALANQARQTLASPVDGAVLDRPTPQGTRVAVNDVVMRVADVRPERLVMRAAVDEEDVTRISVGQRVIMTLYAFEGGSFEGTVKTIYPEADAARRTFEVDVAIARPDPRFQPGMTGELAFVVESKPVATILPSSAVQDDAIYALRGGRIVRLDATIGVRAVDRVEVLGGVGTDDRVIVSPIKPGEVGNRARGTEVDSRAAVGLQPKAEQSAGTFKNFRG